MNTIKIKNFERGYFKWAEGRAYNQVVVLASHVDSMKLGRLIRHMKGDNDIQREAKRIRA
jgi:hypothetical protein